MTGRSFSVFVLLALPTIPILLGCSKGEESFTLKGSVSHQGEPLKSGIVRIHMTAKNRAAMATIQSDGSFEATDVYPGEARVTVEKASTKRGWRQGKAPPAAESKDASKDPMDKYKDVDRSGLTFTIEANKPLDIQLE